MLAFWSRVIPAVLGAVLWAGVALPIAVTAASRSVQPGELVVLTIATARPAASLRVRAFGHELPPFAVDAKTWRVLVGIDLAVAPGTYAVAIEAGTGPAAVRTTFPLLVKARRFPTRTLTVDDAFVNPPPSALERIQQEARRLSKLWEASAPEKLWNGPFVPPVPDPANSAFGTRTILNGQPRNPHSGADFRSPSGTPVKAPNSGRAVLVASFYFTGDTVAIDHGLGLFSLFAHLSALDVHEGDPVKAGEVIGAVGASGRVTGPHLHWAVRANGARIDPLSLLSTLGE
jgi:murein DD-endopeptidase MepM/ murein hydrolase activator NlpD